MKGVLGKKAGMTTIFLEDGKAIPVTVIEVQKNAVLQLKTIDTDGYNAVQLGIADKNKNRANKSQIGSAKKAGTNPKYFVKEIRNMQLEKKQKQVDATIFQIGSLVDVTGISKGKGFQGAIKRHGQSRGPMTHGSKSHRVTGSLGSISSTVKRTKKMPGRMGHQQVTMQNLEVISIDEKLNVLLVKGSIPGPNKSFVVVRDAIKGQPAELNVINLVNIEEIQIKNDLIEEGKKYGAKLNSLMSIEDMKKEIKDAEIRHHQEIKEHKYLLARAKELEINIDKAEKMKLPELREEIEKVETILKEKEMREDNNG